MCYSPEEMRTGPGSPADPNRGPRNALFWRSGVEVLVRWVEVQASPTSPAKLLMLTQPFGSLKEGGLIKLQQVLLGIHKRG